ncbi:MAG: dihydroorotate dehydrogenase electron transfer subunit [Calditrichaeota bacterium]|nr:dihydroorotate dehydrogenase electron transfer subunit [Calditrichota bacterium]
MSLPIAEIGEVLNLRNISPDVWDMDVHSPRLAPLAQAGQFVHIRISDRFIPFLRRPLSIGPIDKDVIKLIFIVRGEGTRLLAAKSPGDKIDLIGPLGMPFPMPSDDTLAVLVAGGIGIAPLLLLNQSLPKAVDRLFLLGMRSLKNTPVDLKYAALFNLQLATDDGSAGFHGNVVDLCSQMLKGQQARNINIFACGPVPMLAKIKDIGVTLGVPTYLSLEVPMGCGVGACQSCAVECADGSGYNLVCRDGPVFEAKDIILPRV